MSYSELVFSDLQRLRPTGRASWVKVLLRVPSTPGVLASIILRAQQCLSRRGNSRVASFLTTLGNALVGVDLGPGLVAGRGLALVHPVGVTMGYGARIGDNVTLAGGVVLAAKHYDNSDDVAQEFPVIDDGATIGAHAVLVGGVRVGKHAMVGANSVVVSDVPDFAIMLGNPARRVGTRPAPLTTTSSEVR